MTTHDHSKDDTLELVKELAWRRYAAARNYPEHSEFGKELVGEVAEYIWRAVIEQNGNSNGNKMNKALVGLVLLVAASLPSAGFMQDGNAALAVVALGAFLLGALACRLIPGRRK